MNFKTLKLPLITLGAVLVLGACGKTDKAEIVNDSETETTYSDSSGEVIEVKGTLKDDGYFKELVTDGINPKVKDTISYETDYKNSDWDGTTLDIEHVRMVSVADFKDRDDMAYKELLSFKYKLTNEGSDDKHITPDNAVLILKDGTEVDAKVFMNYWDDEVLTKNEHKDGFLYFKVKDEEALKEIASVKLTFKAKDSADEEITHAYTVDLPLEAAK